MIGILIGMANTNPDDVDRLERDGGQPPHGDADAPTAQPPAAADNDPEGAAAKKFIPLSEERVKFLVDLMRDVAYYVESKDFELGLPITNFNRYHELWSMKSEMEDEGSYYEDDDDEDEDDDDEDDVEEDDDDDDEDNEFEEEEYEEDWIFIIFFTVLWHPHIHTKHLSDP